MVKKRKSLIRSIKSAGIMLSLAGSCVFAKTTDASTYIIEPKDGAVVSSPVTVKFGLKGMGIAPAGVKFPGTGHHHLLINHKSKVDMTKPLPASQSLRHFGGGQTEVVVDLKPGKHQLQLILGDHLHVPHNPPVKSKTITITVK